MLALGGVFDLGACVAALALAPVLARGVARGVTGGGSTAEVFAWAPERAAARAATEGASIGMGEPANEALGAGPIAAPTATPMASIPAASAALARSEGRRGARCKGAAAIGRAPFPVGEPGPVAPTGLVGSCADGGVLLAATSGDVGVSGGVVIGLVGAPARPASHKLAYIDQNNEEYGRFRYRTSQPSPKRSPRP
jgi:hypothetical protein